MNLDGITNLTDAILFNNVLLSSGNGALAGFALAQAPEPTGLLLGGLELVLLLLTGGRGKRRLSTRSGGIQIGGRASGVTRCSD